MNNYMELVAMNKDKSNKTGSLVLDLVQKMGMLNAFADGSGFKRGDDLGSLWTYVFGNVKVIDNADKCMYELTFRVSCMDNNQETADMFVDVFDHIMPCTGDW